MKKKIILSVFCIVTLLGLFAVTTPASAMTCDSATLTGNVFTGTPPTRARFFYSTNYNTIASWSTSNQTGTATTVQTFNSEGTFPIQQFISGLSENTTYYFRLVVTNDYGTQALNIQNFTTPACPVTQPSNPPSVSLQINGSHSPSAITPGGVASVTWNAQPSNSSTLSCVGSGGMGIWSGGKPLSGLATFYPTQSTTFTIRCTDNASGLSDTDSVTINVTQTVPQICQDTSAINYGGTLPCRYQTQTCQDTSAINYGGTLPCRYQTSTPVSVSITADQSTLPYNGSTLVRWTSTGNPTSCNGTGGANAWAGTKTYSGSFYTGPLTNSVAFNITCTNSTGSSASDSIVVNVGNQPMQTCTDTTATNYGGALPCRYPVTTCQDTSAINYGGTLPCRYQTQTCQDTSAINYGGTLPCRYATQTCQDINATNYGGALPCRYETTQPTVSITADNTSVNNNSSTIIRWYSNGASYCTGNGGTNGWSGNKTTSGSFYTGNLTTTKTFNITCTNNSGISASDSVTVYISGNGSNDSQPTVRIYADETSIDFEDSTRIRWDSDNADYCTASGGTNGWSGNRSTSGSFNTGSLTSDKTYRIVCTNDENGETDSDSVTIRVDDNNDNNSDRPTVTIFADKTNLSSNESTLIRWYPNDADSCNATGGSNGWTGRKSTSGGSFSTGSISRTTTYSINCTNSEGSDSDSVTVYVNSSTNTGYDSAPTAITTDATQLTNTSAMLNSLIFTAGSNTNAWFEWGTTNNLGNSTNQSSVGSVDSTRHSETITGLVTGVTYYFRAVAENSYIRNYGSIMSFTMRNLGGTVAGSSTTVIRPTTIINRGGGTQSLVMLSIDGGSENIFPGERRNYQVTWKNISGQTLRNVILRVIIPEQLSFESSNKGSYSSEDNTLTLEIGTLSPSEDGSTFLLASAKNELQPGQLIVTVANLVYTDASNAQGDALAYATQRANLNGSVLGANAFGSGFLPNTFLGWLFLLILLLIILLLSRYLYNQFKGPQHSSPVVIQH